LHTDSLSGPGYTTRPVAAAIARLRAEGLSVPLPNAPATHSSPRVHPIRSVSRSPKNPR